MGWQIGWDKDLETSMRFRRLVSALKKRHIETAVTRGEASDVTAASLPSPVTTAVGALLRLWVYADSHIREGDVLDCSAAELDEYLELPGFTACCPDEWLVVLEDGKLYLPGFIEKNNVRVKKAPKSGAERQAAYRARKKEKDAVKSDEKVTASDESDARDTLPFPSLPIPSLPIPYSEGKRPPTKSDEVTGGSVTNGSGRASAAESPSVPVAPAAGAAGEQTVHRDSVRSQILVEVLTYEQLYEIERAYPPGRYKPQRWVGAQRNIQTHAARGVPFGVMLAGTQRYHDHWRIEERSDPRSTFCPNEFFDLERPMFERAWTAGPMAMQTPPLHQQIIDAYHRALPDNPRVKGWTGDRQALLNARIAEICARGKPGDTLECWQSIFAGVAQSDFLTGRTENHFVATLEWLLEEKHFLRLIEGQYNNRVRLNGAAAHA